MRVAFFCGAAIVLCVGAVVGLIYLMYRYGER